MLAIEKADAACFQLRQTGADGDQVGVHEFNQCSPQQEIEADERQQC